MSDHDRGLEALLWPSSIAVVGASADTNKPGGRTLRYLREFGYAGRVVAVNPRRPALDGVETVGSLREVTEPVDLVFGAIPGELSDQLLEDAIVVGAGAVILTASGFAEAGHDGLARQLRLRDRASRAGLRLLGPNCQGIANFASGAVASFSSMFATLAPQDGPVAVLSQSGSMSAVPYSLLRERGIGVRYSVSTGNECDVELGEVLQQVVSDDVVELVLVYAEMIRNPASLALAAASARDRGVPIVALVAGRSPEGALAVRSHTAGLSAQDDVVSAFLERHGILRVHSVRELTDTAELYLQARRPRGRELLVVTDSGATAALSADSARDHGLEVSPLTPMQVQRMSQLLPSYATAANPMDLTATLRTDPGILGRILPALARERHPDVVLVGFPSAGEGYDTDRLAAEVAGFAKTTDALVALVVPQMSIAEQFRARGLAVFREEVDAVAALAQLVQHSDLLARHPAMAWTPSVAPVVPQTDARVLDESESLTLLAAAGVRVVEHRLCHSVAEASEAFEEHGGPVVLKVCSPLFPHKSGAGLVRLGLDSVEDVTAAHSELLDKAAGLGVPEAPVLIAPMVRGEAELFVGGRRDPLFGPVIVVGVGGVLAEHVADVALLLPPFDVLEVLDRLRALRSASTWAGHRGATPVDLTAVARAAVAVGRLLTDEPRIESVDINPILVGAAGAVAVDAGITISADQGIPA